MQTCLRSAFFAAMVAVCYAAEGPDPLPLSEVVFPHPRIVLHGDHGDDLEVWPSDLEIVVGGHEFVVFNFMGNLSSAAVLTLNITPTPYLDINPLAVNVTEAVPRSSVRVTGKSVTSLTYVDIDSCHFDGSNATCPFNQTTAFVRVAVVHSKVISALVSVTGWMYFVAWSVSFYPQIYLNYQRASVEGLNFDFLVLNVIGFACYSVYNWMMYFDAEVLAIYRTDHPRSLNPVLINDVVFATHALLACVITLVQVAIYDRAGQRVSYTCIGWSAVLVGAAVVSFILTAASVLNWLQFIMMLSYIKLGVTLSKYVPQALLNFKRKSTLGWSIGNVLLDFTGGTLDICQMVLQASNTDDWSGFTGNPVKFGLGMVSMVFDVLFMIQHYVLYRHSPDITNTPNYGGTDSLDSPVSRNTTSSLVEDSSQDAR